MEFTKFRKIPRLSREIVITEKIDGTNAQIFITALDPTTNISNDFKEKGWRVISDGNFIYGIVPGKRNSFCTIKKDNFGFAKWVEEKADELIKLGPGRHYGEWWGSGIQRSYGLDEKRFSLFNTKRWGEDRPACCNVVPVLYRGDFDTFKIDMVLLNLKNEGSRAAEGFMNPEGIVIFHSASGQLFKKTIENDDSHKKEVLT